MATANSRAHVRHHQGMDGIDALLDQNAAKSANRDELACSGVQHEAGDCDCGNAGIDGSDEGLKGLRSPRICRALKRANSGFRKRVYTRPRPLAAPIVTFQSAEAQRPVSGMPNCRSRPSANKFVTGNRSFKFRKAVMPHWPRFHTTSPQSRGLGTLNVGRQNAARTCTKHLNLPFNNQSPNSSRYLLRGNFIC